jgi:hypothetical protein
MRGKRGEERAETERVFAEFGCEEFVESDG